MRALDARAHRMVSAQSLAVLGIRTGHSDVRRLRLSLRDSAFSKGVEHPAPCPLQPPLSVDLHSVSGGYFSLAGPVITMHHQPSPERNDLREMGLLLPAGATNCSLCQSGTYWTGSGPTSHQSSCLEHNPFVSRQRAFLEMSSILEGRVNVRKL